MKVEITNNLGLSFESDEPWYNEMIGLIFSVKEGPAGSEWKYYVTEGPHIYCGIQAHDCKLVSWGIDDAYDSKSPSDYKYPLTKGITMPKKSVQELASEVFNNLSGKNITAREIEQIVELVKNLQSISEN